MHCRYGETYTWSNVNCCVHNVIVGKLWVEHVSNVLQFCLIFQWFYLFTHIQLKHNIPVCGQVGILQISLTIIIRIIMRMVIFTQLTEYSVTPIAIDDKICHWLVRNNPKFSMYFKFPISKWQCWIRSQFVWSMCPMDLDVWTSCLCR